MAVKRDYGSFARESARLLAPAIESLGYTKWYGGGYGRDKAGWVEGFFLQQSQWGSGDFCVNFGVHVPQLQELERLERVKPIFGLLISWRLTKEATEHSGGQWYQAKNKIELTKSLTQVVAALEKADGWFQQFKSLSDVVECYRIRSNLPLAPSGDVGIIRAINFGLLLLLDGAKDRSASWLKFARDRLNRPMFWDPKSKTFSYDEALGRKQVVPTANDKRQKAVVESALSKLNGL